MTAQYDNWVRFDVREKDYFKIDPELRLRFEIVRVEPKDAEYPDNEKWVIAKKASTKAFLDLKKIEFEIRNP